MTATLYKRLKVDNAIRIYHYAGVLVHQLAFKELNQVSWNPADSASFKDDNIIPVGIQPSAPVAATQKYRPPGARLNDSSTPRKNIYVTII